MRMRGKTSHSENELRAGQRKAARGKEGVRTSAPGLVEGSKVTPGFFDLRRGLWAGDGAAMVTN